MENYETHFSPGNKVPSPKFCDLQFKHVFLEASSAVSLGSSLGVFSNSSIILPQAFEVSVGMVDNSVLTDVRERWCVDKWRLMRVRVKSGGKINRWHGKEHPSPTKNNTENGSVGAGGPQKTKHEKNSK